MKHHLQAEQGAQEQQARGPVAPMAMPFQIAAAAVVVQVVVALAALVVQELPFLAQRTAAAAVVVS